MSTQKIAIDIGYGDTKVFFNGKTLKFPSAVSEVRQAQVDLSETKTDIYTYNGTQY
ncbi:ATPase, partial [Campylobacter jejuni]|nr:ATPase [Campylobacter jejuni]